jgi:nitrate/TMAO reductase-like tetraheme cytochrome c subunit
MATEPADSGKGGLLSRTWRRLQRPSTRWSVLALVSLGIAAGLVGTVGTQVMVAVTGTDAFCGGACHSMQWVAQEHRESVHGVNGAGVHAACHDCHIPKNYPHVLWYKAVAGAKDVFGEMRGVISTEEKFKSERPRMAQSVWAEFKANDSANCRTCHQLTPEVVARQKASARPMHQQVLEGKATCIDCHKGVAHKLPEGVAASAARAPKPHHAKAGLACSACHGTAGIQEPPPTATCLQCHGDRAALIKRTERVNKVVEEKSPVTGKMERVVMDTNPHSGHHDKGRLDCFECHREHTKSVNLCAQCHDIERWMKPTP